MLQPRQAEEDQAATRQPCIISTPLVVVSVVFPLISLSALYLRYKSRRLSRAKLQADDCCMVAAWVFSFSISIPIWIYGSMVGIDFYKVDILVGTKYSLQCIYVAGILLTPALTLSKIAILLFYKRLFSVRAFEIVVGILIGVLTCWCIVFMLLIGLQGDPLESSWMIEGGTRRYDVAALGYAYIGSNIALDVLVLCLPLPIISRLHMATSRKVYVALILWLGCFCVIASCVRLWDMVRLLNIVIEAKTAIAIQSRQLVFIVVEPHIAVLTGCLPCYGPLFKRNGSGAPASLVHGARSIIPLAILRPKGPERSRGSRRAGGILTNTLGNNAALNEGESQVELGIHLQSQESGQDGSAEPSQ